MAKKLSFALSVGFVAFTVAVIGYLYWRMESAYPPPAAIASATSLATPAPTFTAIPTAPPTPTVCPTATPTPDPTPVPTMSPRPKVTPAAEAMQNLSQSVDPPVENGFLPVLFSCNTSKKLIAITIDDCNQPQNMQKIINLLRDYGGKATFFPIGQNISKVSSELISAWNAGFEIENHTWSHCGLYDVDEETLREEIWRQNAAIGELLGCDYQAHFLRPRGGDNRYDQRTHAYIRQLGYYGIAYWSRVGSTSSSKSIIEHARPGDILLYHTTDDDVEKLKAVVPALHRAGYSFVTLNELFGLPANELLPETDHAQPEPLYSYHRIDQTLKENDYLYDVFLMQRRLSELGFLTSAYNGFYGQVTGRAVAAFQQSVGLNATGTCDPETWSALFPNGGADWV